MTDPFDRLMGESPSLQALRERARRVAATPLPVILRGPTGTGKEVLARALHDASGRTGRFVPVDCAALSPALVESELFGHVRGAFTGANRDREGLIAAAIGGTLFLDEIAELPRELQTRLLRLVQEGMWRAVGADSERRGDVRIIAASWKDLGDEVRAGRFRRYLMHRLAVVELVLPPLSGRGDDVLLLANHFLALEAARAGRTPPRMTAALRRHLTQLSWPGNVRELRHAMSWLAVVPQGAQVDVDDLPERLRGLPALPQAGGPEVRTDLPYLEARREWLDTFQDRYVHAILQQHDGNVTSAANASGLDRRTIQRIRARMRRDQTEDPS